MALYRCGGSNLLTNKNVSANASGNKVVKATDDGYEGYVQVTVEPFATLGTLSKSVTSNGSSSFSVISNNKSYSTVSLSVSVPQNMDNTRRAIWSGSASATNKNVSISYNADSLYNEGFRYLEFVGSTGYWENPQNGAHSAGPTQVAQSIVPLRELGVHGVGFMADVPNFAICYAVMPFNIVSNTSIILCPSNLMDISHIMPTGSITNVYAIK